jgi:hypothetical protein
MQHTSGDFNIAKEWRTIALLSIMSAVELLLIVRLFTSPATDVQLIVAIVVVAVLLLVATIAERLQKVTAGPSGINAELRTELLMIKEDIGQTKEQVSNTKVVVQDTKDVVEDTNRKVQRLFVMTMSEPMYHNLKKLGSGPFGKYEMGPGLERELRWLRDIGYIAAPKGVSSIPRRGDNLSDHIMITKSGEEFVRLREELVGPNALA